MEATNPPARMDATIKATSIPEVAEYIFSLAEQSDAARSARVCKNWLEPARNIVWYSVFDLKGLFQLLAPLERSELTRSYVRVHLHVVEHFLDSDSHL